MFEGHLQFLSKDEEFDSNNLDSKVLSPASDGVSGGLRPESPRK